MSIQGRLPGPAFIKQVCIALIAGVAAGCVLFPAHLMSQITGVWGSEIPDPPVKCISDELREEIFKQIEINRAALEKSGKLGSVRSSLPPMFIWPLRQAPHFNYPGKNNNGHQGG